MKRANVKLSPSTRDRLRAAKQGGETYDDVINRLLDQTDEPIQQESQLMGGTNGD